MTLVQLTPDQIKAFTENDPLSKDKTPAENFEKHNSFLMSDGPDSIRRGTTIEHIRSALLKITDPYMLISKWDGVKTSDNSEVKSMIEHRLTIVVNNIMDYHSLAKLWEEAKPETIPERIISARMAEVLPSILPNINSYVQLCIMREATTHMSEAAELIAVKMIELLDEVTDLNDLSKILEMVPPNLSRYGHFLVQKRMKGVYENIVGNLESLYIPKWIFENIMEGREYPFLNRSLLISRLGHL